MQSILFDDSPMHDVLTRDLKRVSAVELPASRDVSSKLLELQMAPHEIKGTLTRLNESFHLSMDVHKASVVPCIKVDWMSGDCA